MSTLMCRLTPKPRRVALRLGWCNALALALPGRPGMAARVAPFQRLAVLEPPFAEHCDALIAMAPPLARSTLGKLVTGVVSEIDQQQKADAPTAAPDPERTQLHQQFLMGLADALDDAGARVLREPVEPAGSEAVLFDNHAALLAQTDTARAVLQRGAEAIGTAMAQRLMA